MRRYYGHAQDVNAEVNRISADLTYSFITGESAGTTGQRARDIKDYDRQIDDYTKQLNNTTDKKQREKLQKMIAAAVEERKALCDKQHSVYMDLTHAALDLIGFIPGIGTVADGLNAALYAAQGDWLNAGLSGVSAAVDFIALAKTFKHTDDVIETTKAVNNASDLIDGRTFKSSYDIPIDEKGFTKSSLELGRKVHKEYMLDYVNGTTKFKEYVLPSGKRIDFIDFDNKIIYELKPHNLNQIKNGEKQLKAYLEEVESIFGKGWKTILDTY